MGIDDGRDGVPRQSYQRRRERVPAVLDHSEGVRDGVVCHSSYQGRAKWVGGQHQGELTVGWALSKISGENDGSKNLGRMNGNETSLCCEELSVLG